MISLRDLLFVSNDHQDYVRRLERAYEQQQKEIERLKGLQVAVEKDVCKCTKPQRELKMVEGKRGWVKDVYCQKCDLPIYK